MNEANRSGYLIFSYRLRESTYPTYTNELELGQMARLAHSNTDFFKYCRRNHELEAFQHG
jgi:hypothetical protein